MAPYFR